MKSIDLDDIQGLIKRGYGTKRFADFILLKIENAAPAREWLKILVPRINLAASDNQGHAINVAFTFAGLTKMGLSAYTQYGFLREFEEGMADKARSRLLGDFDWDKKIPTTDSWEWKDTDQVNDAGVIHIMLMIYAASQEILDQTYVQQKQAWTANGIKEFSRLVTFKNKHDKEHFGFHDGISQPAIKGFNDQKDIEENTLSTGEFILGYKNEYGKYPESPMIKDSRTDQVFDFGKNGTYLVMRQLEQYVKEFWEFMASHSKGKNGEVNIAACVALASAMVGRWPGGSPLADHPLEDPKIQSEENNFLYRSAGNENHEKCPMGAHILRSNPRDSLSANQKESIAVSNHHRILRRGRAYGKPFVDAMQPADVLQKPKDDENRGLFFICLNTNISRQFEFVQHTWINNEKFNGLYNDTDHIAGIYQGDFTIPQSPVDRHIKEIPVFLKVKGGAYFFLPSIKALKFLSEL